MHYKILDHRLGLIPNQKVLSTTDFAEEFQRRTQILIDKTKKNIMQSYLKYKEYQDGKAKAAALEKGDSCFILQRLADHQCSKIRFREFLWIVPYVIEKVLTNEKYKEIRKRTIKLLFHKTIHMIFRGKHILTIFLLIPIQKTHPASILLILINRTL